MSTYKLNCKSEIFAIIVSYNPNLAKLAELLESLRDQVGKVILIDNNSEFFSDIKIICNKMEFVTVESLSQNKGIAYAQNLGLNFSKLNNARYVLFLDQDSSISKDFVQSLKNCFFELSKTNKIGAVCPIFKDERYGFFYPLIILDKYGRRSKFYPDPDLSVPVNISIAISSGIFTSISVIDDVGTLREDFFIDYVDTEWCLRALTKGYLFYAVPSVCMLHAIGDKFISIFNLRIPVHSPFRRYYRIRNAFYLLRLNHVPKILSIREILFNFVHQLILILTQKERVKNTKSLISALKDGIFVK